MAKRSKKIQRKKNPMQTAFTRFMLVVAFFILWIGAISVRLVHLQVNQSDWLRDRAQVQRRDQIKTKMLRGTIFDRSERALAMSVKVKSLFADPAEIEDIDGTAKKVAAALKAKPGDIFRQLQEAKQTNKRFVWLARKVDEETFERLNDQLKDADLKKYDEPRMAGLHWKEEQKRGYPYKSLAAQVVGFSNSDDVGLAGIEMSQETLLHGAVVKRWQDRDRLGRVYEEEETEEREPPKDIVLTISSSIQYKTEEALEKGVKFANAKSGTAIVLDPKTGEILAMANYPSFDPNRYGDFAPENYTNKAIQSIYSPGSVFKLITYSSAMDSNLMTPDGMIDCTRGFIEVAKHRFNDPHATKVMSYKEAMAVSSNVAAIKTGMRVGKENFYDYARKFGVGQPVGIELPAEAKGQFRSPEKWYGDSLASMSIGYEVGVTALQIASAYSTIANDGIKVKPHIIKEIRNSDGTVFSAVEPEKTEIVSPSTARGLRTMLREVVLKGTAKRAQLNGYTSAGKTGTAWKFNAKLKRVDAGKYMSSFIGMAPADNPSVVIAVVMDEPVGGARDGGQVSAPVFREIAEAILPELNVAPDNHIEQEVLTAQAIPAEVENEPTSAPIDETENADSLKEIKKKEIKTAKSKDSKPIAKETKIIKETKKENKPSSEEKLLIKKTAIVNLEKPKGDKKNRSSTERSKQKT
jgi:cell division protein FtsI/penicillin-binding protein 2